MTLFERIVQRFTGSPKAASVDSSLLYGGLDWSNFVRGSVDESSARSVAAVSACCDLIGGSIGCLPMHFYRRTPEGRSRYTPDLWWLFNERPSSQFSAAAFWQFISDSRLLHGDGFARIVRSSPYSPTVTGVEPYHPALVDVDRLPSGRLAYTLHPRDTTETLIVVDQDDMLHFPGAGYNGIRSVSALKHGLKNGAGIAKAADDQAAQYMEDGARPDFAIEVPGEMTPDARETLRKSWMDRHSGQGSKKAPVVLAGGMKLHQLTMSAEDAQLLVTRQFQIEEICRIFGVPPFMIGHNEKTTSWGSGVESMGIGFVKYTLGRHLCAIEQEINHKFFKTSRNFAEFLTAGLERGDLKSRNESYRVALGRAGEPGWMTVNEVRSIENLPPIEGGDSLSNGQPAYVDTSNDQNDDKPEEVK